MQNQSTDVTELMKRAKFRQISMPIHNLL